jgi:sugar/nucleoside kinase (ribokinase family)
MAAAKRIICVGHAALDRIYRIDAFPAQPTKVRALEHIEAGGGMAANAAVAIARLGGAAELWSRVGDDNAGHAIRAGLRVERVDVRYVQAFEGARSSTSAIIVDDKGERLIVGQRDASMPWSVSRQRMPWSATCAGWKGCARSSPRPARTRCSRCWTRTWAHARLCRA